MGKQWTYADLLNLQCENTVMTQLHHILCIDLFTDALRLVSKAARVKGEKIQ